MRKKILYIDPFYQTGHSDFNNGYIKALRETGATLHFVVVKGYEKHLNIAEDEVLYKIPTFLERTDLGGFGNRICHLIALFLIRLKIRFSDYDKVFFSNFDEISFYFSGIKNAILIPHINISESNNKVKFFFLNKVLKKNTCIAFNQSISNYLSQKGNYKIMEQPLGLPEPIRLKQKANFTAREQQLINDLSAYNKILFSPSAQSSDTEFIQKLIDDTAFLAMLKNENIAFVAKGNFTSQNENIIVINYYLSTDLYQYLFLKSDCILLAYPQSFQYRVSAVLFECFANNKRCLVPSTEAFKSYEKHFCYQPYFSNANDLIKLLEAFDIDKQFYKNTKDLQPDFSDLL